MTPQNDQEPLAAGALFADDLRSSPPRLVTLRRVYDEVKAAYDAASEHEDESGEPIPKELRKAEARAWRDLTIEEARIATANESSSGTGGVAQRPAEAGD